MDDSGCEGCFVRVTVVGKFIVAFGCGTYKVPLQRLIVVIVILRLTAKLTEFSINVDGSRLLPLQKLKLKAEFD